VGIDVKNTTLIISLTKMSQMYRAKSHFTDWLKVMQDVQCNWILCKECLSEDFACFKTDFSCMNKCKVGGGRLGQCVIWYLVMNILEKHSGSVFTGSWKMEAVYPDRNLGTHQSDYVVA
jgi:hypothetical protein